jgi:hypothetical protein
MKLADRSLPVEHVRLARQYIQAISYSENDYIDRSGSAANKIDCLRQAPTTDQVPFFSFLFFARGLFF